MIYYYVYRITNIKYKKHYYGSRSSKKLPEEDIGVYYFSSSKDKEFLKDQKNNPQDYKYKVIKKFRTRKEALKLEIKLHNRFNVGINESFYNKSKQTSSKFDVTGKVNCIDKEGNKVIISPKKYSNGSYTRFDTNKVHCYNKHTKNKILVTVDEFRNNRSKYYTATQNKVTAKNIFSNKIESIDEEVFNKDPKWVTPTTKIVWIDSNKRVFRRGDLLKIKVDPRYKKWANIYQQISLEEAKEYLK